MPIKLLALLLLTAAPALAGDWQNLFDGKTLDGWKTNPERGCWTVQRQLFGNGEGLPGLHLRVRSALE